MSAACGLHHLRLAFRLQVASSTVTHLADANHAQPITYPYEGT